jgi:hypothetical protein
MLIANAVPNHYLDLLDYTQIFETGSLKLNS